MRAGYASSGETGADDRETERDYWRTRWSCRTNRDLDQELIERTKHWLADFPAALAPYNEAVQKHANQVFLRNVLDDMRLSLELLLKAVLDTEKLLTSSFMKHLVRLSYLEFTDAAFLIVAWTLLSLRQRRWRFGVNAPSSRSFPGAFSTDHSQRIERYCAKENATRAAS